MPLISGSKVRFPVKWTCRARTTPPPRQWLEFLREFHKVVPETGSPPAISSEKLSIKREQKPRLNQQVVPAKSPQQSRIFVIHSIVKIYVRIKSFKPYRNNRHWNLPLFLWLI